MRRSSMATSQSHHPSAAAINDHRRAPYDAGYHHKPTLVSNVDWGGHRRHDSSDSAWSSYSSSSSASSQALPSPGSSTLQFQPLPHAHVNATRPQKNNNSGYSSNNVSPNLHSPYGVLISDADQPGSLTADPQRLAILRTLKADGPHGTFSLEDPRAASSSRYECSYCQKRFNRPSSLRVSEFSTLTCTCALFTIIDLYRYILTATRETNVSIQSPSNHCVIVSNDLSVGRSIRMHIHWLRETFQCPKQHAKAC